jgi:hypothetical protein
MMPEQKGWTFLEPETPKPHPDLEQKKRRPAVSPFKAADSWPKELAGGPEVLLTATFWPITFPRVRFRCPTFLPMLCLGRGSWPLNGNAPIKIKIREKMQRACT